MSADKTAIRELVWLLRLRQGNLFDADSLSIEFLGSHAASAMPDAPPRVVRDVLAHSDLEALLTDTSLSSDTPVT